MQIDMDGRSRRVHMEVCREDKEVNENCWGLRTGDTGGKQIAPGFLKALKMNSDVVCEAKHIPHSPY